MKRVFAKTAAAAHIKHGLTAAMQGQLGPAVSLAALLRPCERAWAVHTSADGG